MENRTRLPYYPSWYDKMTEQDRNDRIQRVFNESSDIERIGIQKANRALSKIKGVGHSTALEILVGLCGVFEKYGIPDGEEKHVFEQSKKAAESGKG